MTFSPTASDAGPSAHHWPVCDKATTSPWPRTVHLDPQHGKLSPTFSLSGIPMQGVTDALGILSRRLRLALPSALLVSMGRPRWTRYRLWSPVRWPSFSGARLNGSGQKDKKLGREEGVVGRRDGPKPPPAARDQRRLSSPRPRRPSGTDRPPRPWPLQLLSSPAPFGGRGVQNRRWSTRRVILFSVILFADQQWPGTSTAGYMTGAYSVVSR
ncbi:hypothetical protein B0T18DRAFT_228493 [Schizothecium vesticola]|uniref:Uncharacterized protein n=1 Tax=Schizothecium vesticola TaxID=314040 RepID=A0AA40K0C2_9PEZI|nr:hypothetical protein B0T18DRAFT_228493 [Schizothecium vesticola]